MSAPLLAVLLFSCAFVSVPPPRFDLMNLPKQTSQVVLVVSDSWSSVNAALQRFSRRNGKWEQVGDQFPVTLGRMGMGWGLGLQAAVNDGPQKIEGDGRAPAGIFRFGTSFGYGPIPPSSSKLPYRQATERDFYVDDPQSPQYNQWVVLPPDQPDPHRLWKSFEKMKRDDYLYELGIVVEQNSDPVVKGRGSAVFFHIWRRPGAPTAGCTAMAKENLLTLLHWLDPAQHPLLIQVSKEVRDDPKFPGEQSTTGKHN